MSPSSAVAGGSPGFRAAVSRPPKGGRPENAVDSPASSPLRVYRASPGFDPPEQVPSPTAPGRGSFCCGGLGERASARGAEHPDILWLVRLQQFAIDRDDVFIARNRRPAAAIVDLDHFQLSEEIGRASSR